MVSTTGNCRWIWRVRSWLRTKLLCFLWPRVSDVRQYTWLIPPRCIRNRGRRILPRWRWWQSWEPGREWELRTSISESNNICMYWKNTETGLKISRWTTSILIFYITNSTPIFFGSYINWPRNHYIKYGMSFTFYYYWNWNFHE